MPNLAPINGFAFKLSGETVVRAPSASIEVRREDTGALASIYSDEAGTTPIANPSAFADSNGRFRFYAAGLVRGYRIDITDGGFSASYRNVPVGTAGMQDFRTPATEDITPAQITGNQNDYNPTGLAEATVLRVSSDASRNITGQAGGAEGRLLVYVNVGAQPIVFKREDAGSSAANRFAFDSDVTLLADQSLVVQYDANASRWRHYGRSSNGEYRSMQVFTASGTWTKPAGLKRVKVIVVGGGAGGGGANSGGSPSRGVGGGAGAVGIKTIAASALGATETVTVATSAAGGTTSGTPTAGTAGGTSSFGSHVSCTGGSAGSAAAGTALGGVSGGTATGGDINITGGSSDTMPDGAATAEPGAGGDTPLGFGSGAKNVGTNGVGYGSGGASGNHAGGNGGSGAAGLVIVEEFF